MKGLACLPVFITGLLIWGKTLPAPAQITSDNTSNTTVNQSNNNFNILNGMQKGNNLFHSFKEFSIPQGSSAIFNNSTDVVNIINRVTGGNVSNIDGLIKASGNANLFLINPSGIVFGENAKLDIGGSFLGSTASSILFEDGFEFSAVNPQEKPLLTVSVPVGLQMGTNPGAIEVNGSGHNLMTQDANFAPYINPLSFIPSQLRPGLQVKPGKTLALLGGDIQLVGGILTAAEGRVELVSLKEGRVNLVDTSKGFSLDNAKISNFGNIQLLSRALVDVSGAGAQEVNIKANQFNIKDGSGVIMQNRGIQPAGDINVLASAVEFNGAIPDTQIRSGLLNETIAGDAGNINITTESLKVLDGAGVSSRTFGLGNSGFININAAQSIDVIGISPINRSQNSAIGSATLSSGKSGNVKLSTKNLSILDAGAIATISLSSGSAGNVTINSENTQVAGKSRGFFGITTITATTFGEGDAGNLTLNTKTLSIRNRGGINTTSHNSGNAGSITVNATEYVEIVSGDESVPSNINSSVLRESRVVGEFLELPDLPSGDAGNITVNTPYLKLSDYGTLSVSNAVIGNAGTLTVNADLIQLENKANLTAFSNSGEGGNIFVQSDSLQMRRESFIATDAGGEGNGGNITINTDTLAALENSDITANAQNSFGGNVTINAEGIFGTQFREQQTTKSDITATSELGAEFNGVVELNTPGVDPNSGLVELSAELTDSSQNIASGCISKAGSNFVVTGRGGIPQNPSHKLIANRIWLDIRNFSASKNKNIDEISEIPNKPEIVEATGFVRHPNGEVELIATQNKPFLIRQASNCRVQKT
ncbi:filamentous hemagglutinin family N-terminal domain protein [Rivularia sp. PCC 7116]|uniref:two-partner secretion domain-containing protein n=1 Tax=Rivularia sp. PCC 7116 TaxID=373994 RepID=UPI00029ECD37|nr:filamentous hemagglutinin N-terminal domain-containing protein [Rivularia sp. PCC 7116]AFY54829.1 filamentous hemagglutinin family N-terminal domain protein [Rivularia sp. PCC 7116]